MISRVVIIDGYTDEPSGFGVPPYIDVYPRYIAGAIWLVDPSINVRYLTVDELRRNLTSMLKEINNYDMVILVSGVVVPGRYLGGQPIKPSEIKEWFSIIKKPLKILVGAAAKWGFGNIGGSIALPPTKLGHYFDILVKGDPEAFVYDALKYGVERASPWSRLESLDFLENIAIKGSKIVFQHPNYGYNLIAEIETYRGCPRHKTGGCSFCVTHLYGMPRQRSVKSIVREIEALSAMGVRHFRLGRQADILIYGSKEIDIEEWPRPEPQEVERLFYGIRSVAPYIKTLHIDNVNPGTIAKHPTEAEKTLKAIIKYHTPGDVAALGIETVDPVVKKLNNLKVEYDEALFAVKKIFEVGGFRGYNGLPEMLAGINFVLGLIGESRKSYELNRMFLEEIYMRKILVRRINVRSVLVLPGTRMAAYGIKFLKKNEKYARWFKKIVLDFSERFLKILLPEGSIIKNLYVEYYDPYRKVTYARQAGSYPLVVEIPCRLNPPLVLDAYIYSHSGRSVRGLPLPLNANNSSFSTLVRVVGADALKIVNERPFKDNRHLYSRHPSLKGVLSVDGFSC